MTQRGRMKGLMKRAGVMPDPIPHVATMSEYRTALRALPDSVLVMGWAQLERERVQALSDDALLAELRAAQLKANSEES